MANTFSQLYHHIVFSTYQRRELISERMEGRLYPFLTSQVNNRKGKVVAINGMSDHIHLLIRTIPERYIPGLVKDLKSGSTRFIKRENLSKYDFNWQEGYGIFSVSHSQVEKVKKYIQNQKEHHRGRTFEEEYRKFMKVNEVDFNEKYLFG